MGSALDRSANRASCSRRAWDRFTCDYLAKIVDEGSFRPAIKLEKEDGDRKVYRVTSEREGKEISGPMIFRRVFGEWKIDEG